MAKGLVWRVHAKVAPEQAYAYVADFTRHPEWGMDEMTIKPRQPGPAAVGSRFDAEGTLFNKRNPSTVTVTDLEPPRRLGFDAQDKQGISHHEFRFMPQDGGTLIEREMTGVKQPFFGPILLLLFRGPIDKNFNGALARLKDRLETRQQS